MVGSTRSEARVGVLLLHGAGDSHRVWHQVRERLNRPSWAVDVPGRGEQPSPLVGLTPEHIASSVSERVNRHLDRPVILVGHSAGGISLPLLAERLPVPVTHMIFLAGLIAEDGGRVIDIVRPGASTEDHARSNELLTANQRATLARSAEEVSLAEAAGLVPCPDRRLGNALESITLMGAVVRWPERSRTIPRTWVRCLDDEIQDRGMQQRLFEASGAHERVDLAAGHDAARLDPDGVARVIELVAGRYDGVVGAIGLRDTSASPST